MSNTAVNFSAMNNAILKYIDSKIPKDMNKAHIGKVTGSRVIIGDKSFVYTPAVDLYFGNNSKVACILPENTNNAVIVGVV